MNRLIQLLQGFIERIRSIRLREINVKAWRAYLGYAAFSIFALLFFLIITFPYDAVRDRIVAQVATLGYDVTIRRLGPGFLSVTATDVEIAKQQSVQSENAPTLKVSRLSLGPSLFPLGFSVNAKLFNGSVQATVGGLRKKRVDLSLDALDMADEAFETFTGIKARGKLNGSLKLSVPLKKATASPTTVLDFTAANGSLELDVKDFNIEGGTVRIALYGDEVLPIDLPKASFGDITGLLKVFQGSGSLDKLTAKSDDLEIQGTGKIKLALNLPFSELDAEIKVKADPAFVGRLGLIGSALTLLPNDATQPDFRVARISGLLGRPQLRR